MPIEKTPFRQYDPNSDPKIKPLVIRLNDKEREMLDIAMYAFNNHSQGGTLKLLAEIGFKNVILCTIGMENLHYLTSGERVRLVRNRPDIKHYSKEL